MSHLVFNTAGFHNNLEIKSAFEKRDLFSKIMVVSWLKDFFLCKDYPVQSSVWTSRVTSPLWEYPDVEICTKKETKKYSIYDGVRPGCLPN